MSMSTWLPLAAAAVSTILSAILGRGWGRRSTLKQIREEGLPDGPARDVLMEPMHRLRSRLVVPGERQRRRVDEQIRREEELSAAWSEATEAAAEARRAWDEFCPGWNRFVWGLGYSAALSEARSALRKDPPNVDEARRLIDRVGEELEADERRIRCVCGTETKSVLERRLDKDFEEWERCAARLGRALARLSALDGQDWPFVAYPNPIGVEGHPVEMVWQRLREGRRPAGAG